MQLIIVLYEKNGIGIAALYPINIYRVAEIETNPLIGMVHS
jgi:hypothetical protein